MGRYVSQSQFRSATLPHLENSVVSKRNTFRRTVGVNYETKRMTVEEYKQHGYKFMQNHSAIDYFITGLILRNFYDFDNSTDEENEKIDDLLKWFLADLRFNRKVELFREILERDYPQLFNTYEKTFAKKRLERLNTHRNLLAHSFIMNNDQQVQTEIKLTSFTGKNTKQAFKVTLDLQTANERSSEIAEILSGLRKVYDEIGINTGRNK